MNTILIIKSLYIWLKDKMKILSKKTSILFIIIFLGAGAIFYSYISNILDNNCAHKINDDHNFHSEHRDIEENDHEHHDVHSGHDEHDLQKHDGEDKIKIRLSAKSMDLVGIEIEKIREGQIQSNIELIGEVGYNEDRLAHIVPRFPGIAKRIYKKLGDFVKTGDVLAEIESNESLSSYKIKSLIPGRIIQKHITLGEFVSDETTIFKVADLSTVWINLAVYSKDLHNIKIGQKVNIESVGTNVRAGGIVSYIQPIFNEETRSFTARVVLHNKKNQLRPGMFVKAKILLKTGKKIPIVLNNALQVVNEKLCVFVLEETGVFRLVNVTIGKQGVHYSHLISGLNIGDSYVAEGSFELKAKLVTSDLGGHAGHGH